MGPHKLYPFKQVIHLSGKCLHCAFSALTLLAGFQEGHPAYKKWWGAGIVICLERGGHAYGTADATATHCLLLQ